TWFQVFGRSEIRSVRQAKTWTLPNHGNARRPEPGGQSPRPKSCGWKSSLGDVPVLEYSSSRLTRNCPPANSGIHGSSSDASGYASVFCDSAICNFWNDWSYGSSSASTVVPVLLVYGSATARTR